MGFKGHSRQWEDLLRIGDRSRLLTRRSHPPTPTSVDAKCAENQIISDVPITVIGEYFRIRRFSRASSKSCEPLYTRRMNSELTNQSVVVIGGTSGMGLAIARLAASRGAYVTVASRSPDKVAAAASELGVTGQPLDTTNEASVREFFSAAGRVDHLIVTASSVRTGTLKDSPLADGEFTFRSKFFGPYLCAKYAQMKPTGSIRNPFAAPRPQRCRAGGS